MDLYGDLPPASSGDTPQSNWSQTQTALRPRQLVNEPQKQSADPPAATANKNKNASVLIAAKLLPRASTSLAFRPRQTAPLNPKTGGALTGSTGTGGLANASVTIEAESPSVNSQLLTEGFTVSSTQKKENKENVTQKELNDNYSFDVEDAYDPRKPNDYIAYCEERLEMRRLAKLQEENKAKLHEFEQMREENAKQRQLAVASGDYSSLLTSSINQNRSGDRDRDNTSDSSASSMAPSAGRGRGAGRGLVNLPAWMTQKMESEGNHETDDACH